MKKKTKQLTFRHMETTHGPPWTRQNGYEMLDFILVPERWKNTVANAESDTSGFIPTDHYPIIAEIKIRLKAIKKVFRQKRIKFREAEPTHKINYNNSLDKKSKLS